MIPVPNFTPGQTLSTAGGIHVSNPETDPPTPPPNGNYSFNPWGAWVGSSGSYEIAVANENTTNANFPLSVSPQGNLVMTDLATGQIFLIA